MQRKTGMIRVFAVFLILLKINIICNNQEVRAATINVFAASSLAGTLEKASKLYKTNSEQQIRYSFASSSALAKQIVTTCIHHNKNGFVIFINSPL